MKADLSNVDLSYSNLYCAHLSNVNPLCAVNVPHIPMMACPEVGEFIGWKKANGRIVKLLIPADAKRSSSNGPKCRCDKAKVLAIETLDGEPSGLDWVASDFDG